MGLVADTLVFFLVVKALAYGFVLEDAVGQTTSCTAPDEVNTYVSADDFSNQALDWHNYLRCVHGVSAMTLNDELTTAAQTWADKMANGTVDFSHSERDGVGENIAYRGTSGNTPAPAWHVVRGKNISEAGDYQSGTAWHVVRGKNISEAGDYQSGTAWHVVRGKNISDNDYGYAGSWYCSECEEYDFEAGGYQSGTGHFTQIILSSSTELGCAASFRDANNDQGTGARTYVVCQYKSGGNGTYNGTSVSDYVSGYTCAGICPVSSVVLV